ncbi:MAG: ATP-binding protein [Bacteroidales bacterium]
MLKEKEIAQIPVLESMLRQQAGDLLETLWNQSEYWGESWLQMLSDFFGSFREPLHDADRIRLLGEHIACRRKLAVFLQERNLELQNQRSFIFPERLAHEMEAILQQLPVWVWQEQAPQRFQKLPHDRLRIRFFKTLKRTGFAFTSLPVKTANVFRKIFRRPLKTPAPWKQRVPVRKLVSWYYHVFFMDQFAHLLEENQLKAAQLIHEYWMWDNQVYEHIRQCLVEGKDCAGLIQAWQQEYVPAMRSMTSNAKQYRKQALASLDELLQQSFQAFEVQFALGGTLEFARLGHREKKRKRQLRRNTRKLTVRFLRRINTLLALTDDWAFNQEIYILAQHVKKTGLTFLTRLVARGETVDKKLNLIAPVLEQMRDEIGYPGQDEAFRKELEKIKQKASRELQAGLLPELINVLMEQNYPLLIDDAEQAFEQELGKLAHDRILIAGFDPSKGYASKSLQRISPRMVIEFEMAVRFKKAFLEAKTHSIDYLEQYRHDVEDLGRMVVYNLDSAIALWDQQGENALADSLLDARESMQRAAENLHQLRESLTSFSSNLSGRVQKAGKDFTLELKTLTDNRNVEQIRFRIVKARAIRKSSDWLRLLKSKGEAYFQRAMALYRLSAKDVKSRVSKLRGRLGLQGLDTQITSRISEFLVSSPDSLPFVYRRLFQIEPLRETTFYFERKHEKMLLQKAWEKWQKGVFTPVLICGEKGSGISTFVHMFVKEYIQRSPHVFSITAARRITQEEELLALLGNSLRGQPFEKAADFYDYADKQPPFVVFVDKLHLLFLRQPGGFNTLKKFFELISQTSKKIFWICSCGKYASLYLDKSVGLYSYFPAVIAMQNLRMEEVRKVIMLRHKASGYALQCLPGKADLLDKAYARKSDTQRQAWLLDRFFASLNRLTQSNIAFALLLWLRSAHKSEGNIILLDSLEDIDFGFMYNLPDETVFALHALLLHENLDVFQLSQVLNTSKRQAWLMLMRLADRGMVTEDRGIYTVHPLLYRQTISLLKDRNLIY